MPILCPTYTDDTESYGKKRKITMGRLEDLAKGISTIFPPELILASNYLVDGDEKEVLVEEHPETLTSRASLASTYRNQGRWKEVESLFSDMGSF